MTQGHTTATDQFANLQRGDLVQLRHDFKWLGGKFAGKIVEITHAKDYGNEVPGLVIYTGQMRARGGVVFHAIPFTSAEVGARAAGWCSTGTCDKPVINENEPCDEHRPPVGLPRPVTPPDSLVHFAHQLYAERLHAFAPAHVGGPCWVLASEVDADDLVTIVNDDVVSIYTWKAWDPCGDGGDPLVTIDFEYDEDVPGAKLQATLQALDELEDIYRLTFRAAR